MLRFCRSTLIALKNLNVNIVNKKARFEYDILDIFTAGIVLSGTEIKSIRQSKASIRESFCEFSESGELFVVNMTVEHYENASYNNHSPRQQRKLLLNRKELRKLRRQVQDKGITIIPTRLFINNRGLAKLQIALAKGKKLYDKRQTIQDRESKIKLDRIIKSQKR